MSNTNDLIRRSDAIDAVYERIKQIGFEENADVLSIRQAVREVSAAQPELIEQSAYVRGFEQGRTQGMIDANLQQTCNQLATDCISRQKAVDALNIDAELLRRVLDNTDIVGTERAKYEWGLGLIESHISDMKDLPSAQPYTEAEIQKMQDLEQAELEKAYELGEAEALSGIVWCKDCVHFESNDYVMFCKHPDGLDSIKPESFCSYGGKKDAEIH